MKKVCCFGEVLLRLSPDSGGEWLQKNVMPVHIGGAELNVASALARWNIPVKYVSAAPDNYLSRHIVNSIAARGIDTADFVYSGNRLGTYYLPQGIDLKNAAGVIYDRAYSSFYELQPGMVDWEAILKNVSWFHFSAIDPAVSQSAADVCREVLQIASSRNITISVDLNYRSKLWQYGANPVDIMPGLVQYCTVIMGNVWAAEQMLGVAIDPYLQRDKASFIEQSKETSAAIIQKFPRCQQVANTFRLDANDVVKYYATLFTQEHFYVSKEHQANAIADKVGSGDCFMGGLIYGNVLGCAPQETIDFAAAAAFDKLFIFGDATTSAAEDIKKRI